MIKPHTTEVLLREIVTVLCRNTKEPTVYHSYDDGAIIIHVSTCDHGRVVGKKGIVIWALSTIAWYADMAAARHTVPVKLVEPIESNKPLIFPFKPLADWDSALISKMTNDILVACLKDKGSWVLEKIGDGEAIMHIKLDAYLHTACSDPDFEEAISVIIRAAGMANGCVIRVQCVWA